MSYDEKSIEEFLKLFLNDNNNFEQRLELIKIYSDILDDIILLSKELDNKTVIEHHELFTILLLCGYLKCDNSTCKIDEIDISDERTLYPELTLNNHGVCRNTSLMETDLMDRLGFKSFILFGNLYSKGYSKELEVIKNNIELGKIKNDNIDEIKRLISRVFPEKIDRSEKDTDHSICMVNDDEYSYYLDALNCGFYTRCGNTCKGSFGMIFDINVEKMKQMKMFMLETKKVMSIKNINIESLSAAKKIKENIDMLEAFKKVEKEKFERAEEIYQKHLKKRIEG